MAARLLAILAVVAAFGVMTAGPAAATGERRGRWVPYGDTYPPSSETSRWACTGEIPVTSGVTAQVCAIRSSNGQYVQGAAIVRNDRSGLYGAQVALMMERQAGVWGIRWSCPNSGVGSHTYSVCFGETFRAYADFVRVAQSGANGVNLGKSPWI